MLQKISLSNFNLGEVSQRAIGDYENEVYPQSCRILQNFVVSEMGKIYRRPGFKYHNTVRSGDIRLIPYYLADDTILMLFYTEGTFPDLTLKFEPYIMTNGQLEPDTPYDVYTAEAIDFEEYRPKSFDLRRISYVQVDDYIYITHPNMKDPYEIKYDKDADPKWTVNNYSEHNAYYFDIRYDTDKWNKKVQSDLNAGGGGCTDCTDTGWVNYTGNAPADSCPNGGKGSGNYDPQTFKYLAAVTFSNERLIFARGPYIHGTVAGDILGIGLQWNFCIPADVDGSPPQILSSDPFMYRASSDLGYEQFYWLAGDAYLMGGAQNGSWILSNPQIGNIDTTNPLMYKATSHGAYYVPGKTIGDALIYFQRPGEILREFIYSDANKNYVATNMTRFADHLFYESKPVEMVVQRSPFNIAWILRDDGELISFTYDRENGLKAWARHNNQIKYGENGDRESDKIKAITIYSDGLNDSLAAIVSRKDADGNEINTIEIMNQFVPGFEDMAFTDSYTNIKLPGKIKVTGVIDNVGEPYNFVEYDSSEYILVVGDIISFEEAKREEYEIPDFNSYDGDYIYGYWEIVSIETGNRLVIKSVSSGIYYNGIYDYIDYGYINIVSKNIPTSYENTVNQLRGKVCKAVLDGTPKNLYVSKTTNILYNADTIPEDWNGDESLLDENQYYFNNINIGLAFESMFSPFIVKKSIHKGRITKMELELFRSLGGKVGVAKQDRHGELYEIKLTEIKYPADFEMYELYTGTIKPQIVGGFTDDPFLLVIVDDASPFNITNVIYYLEANI